MYTGGAQPSLGPSRAGGLASRMGRASASSASRPRHAATHPVFAREDNHHTEATHEYHGFKAVSLARQADDTPQEESLAGSRDGGCGVAPTAPPGSWGRRASGPGRPSGGADHRRDPIPYSE